MQNLLVFVYGEASAVNNKTVVYNTETGSLSEFSGWSINSFTNINGDIYAGSAGATTLYKVFEGYDDAGLTIGTEFEQELELGPLNTLKNLRHFYIQGFLTQGKPITIRFDIYDRTGKLKENRQEWRFQSGVVLGDALGYDEIAYDAGQYDGDVDSSSLVESFDGAKLGVNRALRVRVNFTSADTAPHQLNWFSVSADQGAPARRRKLTLTN